MKKHVVSLLVFPHCAMLAALPVLAAGFVRAVVGGGPGGFFFGNEYHLIIVALVRLSSEKEV